MNYLIQRQNNKDLEDEGWKALEDKEMSTSVEELNMLIDRMEIKLAYMKNLKEQIEKA